MSDNKDFWNDRDMLKIERVDRDGNVTSSSSEIPAPPAFQAQETPAPPAVPAPEKAPAPEKQEKPKKLKSSKVENKKNTAVFLCTNIQDFPVENPVESVEKHMV